MQVRNMEARMFPYIFLAAFLNDLERENIVSVEAKKK